MSEQEDTDILDSERQDALAKSLRTALEAGLNKRWNMLERPQVLARMLLTSQSDCLESRCHDLESLLGAYYGHVAVQWIGPCVALHAKLQTAGITSRDNAFEFASDACLWAVADRIVPLNDADRQIEALCLSDEGGAEYRSPPKLAKAFVLETQNRKYAFVLNQQYFRWSLHIRRYWADLQEAMASGHPHLFAEHAARKDLSLLDVARLAAGIADEYGDDLPGVPYPHRPHLSTVLNGSLEAGSKDAGIALRYGDGRDKGYVLSVGNDTQRPYVNHGEWVDYGTLGHVSAFLNSAMSCIDEDLADPS